MKKRMTKADIDEFFGRLAEADPAPKGELDYINDYTLLVAVVLSAQATDVGVNKATKALFEAADTPAKMVALGEERVRDYIKTIGLYKTKAKNVIGLSRQLIEEHGGIVPADREALVKLPGVGRKTANVVLNIAFGHPTIAVDTHIFRVSNRTGLAPRPRIPATMQPSTTCCRSFAPSSPNWPRPEKTPARICARISPGTSSNAGVRTSKSGRT